MNVKKVLPSPLPRRVCCALELPSSSQRQPWLRMTREKCWRGQGEAKNGCATKGGSCAGTARDGCQRMRFVVVPRGCAKLAGGSLQLK